VSRWNVYRETVLRIVSFWLVLACAGAWWGSRSLDVEVDILALLPSEAREVQGLKLLRTHFETQNDLLLLIEASDGAQADAAVKSLQENSDFLALVKESRVLNGSTDVKQAGALLSWVLQNAPSSSLERLRARMEPGELKRHLAEVIETLASSPDIAMVQRLSYDPLGLTEVLEKESMGAAMDSGFSAAVESVRLVRVLPKEPISSYKSALSWLAQIRNETNKLSASSGVKVGFTGEIVFMAEAGGGMEKDLSSTISASMGLIGLLFWIMYRRIAPLLWITFLLAVVLGITLGLGALILGKLNAMNLGFAAIVLGLVVDYGVLIYQETGGLSAGASGLLRKRVSRSILGAGVSTAAVFLILCLSQFSGLRELGVLVGIGVTVGAIVMVSTFPVIALRYPIAEKPKSPGLGSDEGGMVPTIVFVLVVVGALAYLGFPRFDGSSAPMRPKNSEALATLGKLERLGMGNDASKAPLIAMGRNSDEIRNVDQRIQNGAGDHWLPVAFLPNDDGQKKARPILEEIAAAMPKAVSVLKEEGFEDESVFLLRSVEDSLQESLRKPWPLAASQVPAADLLERFLSEKSGEVAALGWVKEGADLLEDSSLYSPTWAALGLAISDIAIRDALYRMLPVALIFLIVLFFVLGSWRDVLIALGTMLAGFAALFALMALLGQEWNLMSIAALVLLTGTAEDYSIHMLLALRREKGDVAHVRATTGRAVIFCALSSCIGFASLTFASNGGIASLGLACALGLGSMMMVAVYLLPVWWQRWGQRGLNSSN
jgi:uncharacterized protein